MQGLNITDFILCQRPDTKWKSVLVTNVRFTLYHLNYPLGTVTIQLPDYVKKKAKLSVSWIKTLRESSIKITCVLFAALPHIKAINMIGRLEMHTESLFAKWVEYMQNKCPNAGNSLDPKTFKGVELSQPVYFEKYIEINVNIFRLQED